MEIKPMKDEVLSEMSDWRNWREGDWLECLSNFDGGLTAGKLYTLLSVEHPGVYVFRDDDGEENGALITDFRWHSRPVMPLTSTHSGVAIKVLLEMITSSVTPDGALKYTQSVLNLTHAEATLANMRK
jgi:hypothetical protein